MLSMLISFASILITLLFVVGTHEAAHFLMARAVGVKVLTFSIGFGKKLFSYTDKRGTEYIFALIPLGGYVRMLDSTEEKVAPDELTNAYDKKNFFQKSLIMLAGPVSNLTCAFFLYWLIFVIGFVTPKPIIGEITQNSLADLAGLKPNQEFVAIDHTPTTSWTNVLFRLMGHYGDKDPIALQMKNKTNGKISEHTLSVDTWKMDKLSPDPFSSLGFTPYEPPIPLVIGVIQPDSPAARAHLRINDKLIAIDGKPLKNWIDVITLISTHPNQTLKFTLERQGKTLTVPITLAATRPWFSQPKGRIGFGPNFVYPNTLLQTVKLGPLEAIPRAGTELFDFIKFNLIFFGKLVTGKLSLQSLGGPITIFDSAGAALNIGLLPFISFLAFISIAIGVINLLPIPGLDGGQWMVLFIEWLIRRPLPDSMNSFLYRAGFIFIIFLLAQAVINDFLRLFHG